MKGREEKGAARGESGDVIADIAGTYGKSEVLVSLHTGMRRCWNSRSF